MKAKKNKGDFKNMALSQQFYKNNRRRFAKQLETNSGAILYSGRAISMSLDATYPLYVNNNFYYLTGIQEENVHLLITKDQQGDVQEVLFIGQSDQNQEKWFGRQITPSQAQTISGIENIDYNKNMKTVCQQVQVLNVYYDYSTPKHQYSDAQKGDWLSGKVKKDLAGILTGMRLIKQKEEIEAIEKAVQITQKGLAAILQQMKPGMYEYEMAALFEYEVKRHGASGLSFPSIAVSGENGYILHYIDNQAKLKAGDLILFDVGAKYQGYSGDISRTYPINGVYQDEQAAIYEMVLNVQQKMIQQYRPGIKMQDLQAETEALFYEGCHALNLDIPKDDIHQYYYHGLGHSLGLDTHDTNAQRDYKLEANMVITCEPGIYMADRGIGIRIEDDILVTPRGGKVIHPGIPKTIQAVEAAMK